MSQTIGSVGSGVGVTATSANPKARNSVPAELVQAA